VLYEQAALAYLESIIYDPDDYDPSHHGPNGVNGEDGGVSGNEGDEGANGEAGARD
jgi:hypothetical protein